MSPHAYFPPEETNKSRDWVASIAWSVAIVTLLFQTEDLKCLEHEIAFRLLLYEASESLSKEILQVNFLDY